MTLTSSSETRQGLTSDSASTEQGTDAPIDSRRSPYVRRAVGKLLGSLLVLWGAATAAFLAQVSLPGDRATVILNIRAGQAIARTPQELAEINQQYGLQHPLIVQYIDYMRGLLVGDFGISYQEYKPVTQVILAQITPTITLTIAAVLLAWVIMIVWVSITAGRGPRLSSAGSTIDTTAAGLPHYWLGIILLLVFALGLHWLPVISGNAPIGIVLPALTLAIPLAGFMGQATRAEFERSLAQPFVLSARMRGMGDWEVRLRHVLRHSVLPAVTLSGWALGATISGAVVVETVFSRPGIGTILVAAVNSQDLPVVTGIVVLIAALYVVANLLVDLAYSLIDPRVKRS
jgi:peptide/nickel transport system permease protein